MSSDARAKVFWSGGSQAVRIPKSLRVPGSEVSITRRGKKLVITPIEDDRWVGFWDRLLTLKTPVKRYKTRSIEKRKPI